MTVLNQPQFIEPKINYFKYKIINEKKSSFVKWICCCAEDSNSDDEKPLDIKPKTVKPYGLFGYKSFNEVVEEIKESSEFVTKRWDLMSVIVKSGENIY